MSVTNSKCIKFIFLASVDQGKSTIAGNILYLTGNVDQHLFEKTKSEVSRRQIWSALLDIYEQERVRGKTFEYSAINFTYRGEPYTMLDCPGHSIYIRSTIEAIYEDVKIACFVVNVAEFEAGFNAGTAKEHITLARAVGIEHIIVCINHMDVANWSQEKYEEARLKIDKFLKNLKFKSVQYIPMSGYQGINTVHTDADLMPWYKKPPLIELIRSTGAAVAPSTFAAPLKIEPDTKFKFYICNCKSILCAGYRCVMHADKREYEVELDCVTNVKNSKLNYVKTGETMTCKIIFLDNNQPETVARNRFILRSEDYTVGYGMGNTLSHVIITR